MTGGEAGSSHPQPFLFFLSLFFYFLEYTLNYLHWAVSTLLLPAASSEVPPRTDRCEWMQEEKNPIGEKLFLHLHTSYPDAGWDLPKMLKEYEVGNRVMFTYSCKLFFFHGLCYHIKLPS